MGRWTPLILMAGGVAILLGTLLGINFPMGGQQSASAPTGRRESSVLPANINVNSAATRNDPEVSNTNNSQTTERNNSQLSNSNSNGSDFNRDPRGTSVAQNNASTTTETVQNTNTTDTSTSEIDTRSNSNNTNQDKRPIRALW